jgi:predicted metal-dependent phosphotriesterase family hydrolase
MTHMVLLTDTKVEEMTKKIVRKQAKWLHEVVSKLADEGIDQDKIDIAYHPNNSITVSVNGVEKYSCSVELAKN